MRSERSTIHSLVDLGSSSNTLPKQLLVYILSLSYFVLQASASITVISQLTNNTVLVFEDQPASFIPERVSYYGIQGYVVYANPPNACTPVDLPPDYPEKVNWILLARRSPSECGFQRKIEIAQNAGYAAILVHNIGSNSTEAMGAEDPAKLVIYACFIGEYYGHLLKENYSYPADKEFRYFIRIQDDFSLNSYLLPFAIVVGVCFVVMLVFMLWQQVVRWVRERRRSRRRKLPASALKKLPITKWTKGDPYETCAVCLEDFVEQDKVRVLPCSHGFHAVCIDPWLTKGRRVCPIDRKKVVLAEERFSESDTETEDETAPLLGNASTSGTVPNPVTTGSTFVQQRENPFRRARRRALQRRPGQSNNADTSVPPLSPNDDPETSSSGSDDNFQESTSTVQSVPIIAQVHSSGSTTSFICGDIPSGSIAPFPSLKTTISHHLMNRSTDEECTQAVDLPDVFVISNNSQMRNPSTINLNSGRNSNLINQSDESDHLRSEPGYLEGEGDEAFNVTVEEPPSVVPALENDNSNYKSTGNRQGDEIV